MVLAAISLIIIKLGILVVIVVRQLIRMSLFIVIQVILKLVKIMEGNLRI